MRIGWRAGAFSYRLLMLCILESTCFSSSVSSLPNLPSLALPTAVLPGSYPPRSVALRSGPRDQELCFGTCVGSVAPCVVCLSIVCAPLFPSKVSNSHSRSLSKRVGSACQPSSFLSRSLHPTVTSTAFAQPHRCIPSCNSSMQPPRVGLECCLASRHSIEQRQRAPQLSSVTHSILRHRIIGHKCSRLSGVVIHRPSSSHSFQSCQT